MPRSDVPYSTDNPSIGLLGRLPVELRRLIYGEVAMGMNPTFCRRSDPVFEEPHLLHLSRQIRQEASAIFYSRSRFQLNCWTGNDYRPTNWVVHLPMGCIRRMRSFALACTVHLPSPGWNGHTSIDVFALIDVNAYGAVSIKWGRDWGHGVQPLKAYWVRILCPPNSSAPAAMARIGQSLNGQHPREFDREGILLLASLGQII